MLSSGTRLAQYEIVEPLGSGGMGEVYRARDSRLHRDVAIKVLPQHLAADPEMRGRFEREARAVAALSHPGILAIHELARVDDLSFAVMELLEGQTLRERLAGAALPWRQAVDIGAQLADAVASAHARGIIHRDLKPENIFITRDQRVKVLDFGLARSTAALPPGEAQATMSVITSPGLLLGTMGYIAPEQIHGAEATPHSDIFAIGCVLHEMITGRMTFARATAAETMAAIIGAEPSPPSAVSPDVPPALDRVVEHCLAKRPRERFQAAGDVAVALRAIASDSGLATPPAPLRTRRSAGKSVAVLPFDNLTEDPEADYLCDGLTESIINCLSQLPKLRVVPRSTVFRYKGRADDANTVGLALNVRSLVTGRIVKRGGNLNIQAELVDVNTDSQLWGDQYQRSAADLASLQQEIAFQISEGLRVRLSGEERKRLKARPTESSEAYQHYLRGRYHWNKWTPEGFTRAIEEFEKAIEADPNYALAYSGLSDTWGVIGYYGLQPTRVAMPKARTAALRALALDDRLAEAHVTMALTRICYDWDWAAAEEEFRTAIALNPRLPSAHSFYGLFSVAAGETDAGIERAVRGRDLDPLSAVANICVVWSLYFARQFDRALEEARRALELDSMFIQPQMAMTAIHEQKGNYEKATALMAQHRCFWGVAVDGAEDLVPIVAKEGIEAYHRAMLAHLEALGGDARFPPIAMLVAHVRAGRIEEALKRFEGLLDEHGGHAVFAFVEPAFDPLRGNPRFEALLNRLQRLRSPNAQHD